MLNLFSRSSKPVHETGRKEKKKIGKKDGVDAKHTTNLSTKDRVKKTSIKEKINDKREKKSQKHLVRKNTIISSSDSESSTSIPVSDPGSNDSEISSDDNDYEISFDDYDSEMASQQSDNVTGSQASISTTQDSTPPPIKHKSLPQSDPKPSASQQSDDVTGSQDSTSTTEDSTPPPRKPNKSLSQPERKPSSSASRRQ